MEKRFAGMSHEEFRAAIQPSLDARAELTALESAWADALARREAADRVSMRVVQRVVAGVLADADEGDNSAIYQALGYVRRNDRASGLRRKLSKPKDAPAPA